MKKFLAMLLASLMVVSLLAGCAGGEESKAESKAEESKAEESKAEESKAEESKAEESADAPAGEMGEDNGVAFYLEGTHIVDDEVELSCMQYIRDTDAIVMEGLWWVDHLYEVTGVKINYDQVNQSDWKTQLNLTFASGDYPDLLVGTSDVDREIYGADQGILREWDDLLEYMPVYKERLEQDPICASPMISSDGKMYGMACTADDSTRIGNSSWFINGKWLDEAGLEIPQTTDELLDALRAFKAADPGRIGYEAIFDEMTTCIFCCFGIPEGSQHIYIDEDYKVLFTPEMDHYREGVELLNTMYTENLMDQANITQDGNAKIANYNTNNVGLTTMHRLKSMGWDILEEDMVYLFPPAAEGCNVQIQQGLGVASGKGYITTTNPYPIISARWYEAQLDNQLCWESFYGPEGTLWNYNDEGKCELGPAGDQGVFEYALGVCGIYYLPGFMYNDVFQQPDYRIERINYHNMIVDAGLYAKVPLGYATQLAKYSVDEANERTEIFANLEAIYDGAVAEMIMHGVTDDNWNAMLDQLNGANKDRYIEIYQKGLDDYMATQG